MHIRIFENVSSESISLSHRSPTGMSFVSCKTNTQFELVIYAERMGFRLCNFCGSCGVVTAREGLWYLGGYGSSALRVCLCLNLTNLK